MKIYLINIDPRNKDPPLGLAYIASYIRAYSGIRNITIIDRENPVRTAEKEKPDIIGMGSYSYNFNYANKIAKDIKNVLDVPIIIGGHHITALPHHLVSSNFDIGVMGEGEQTMLELMQLYEKEGALEQNNLKRIKGLAYKSNGAVKITETRPQIEPLDRIPFPARDLLDMDFYHTIRKASFGRLGIYSQMITSRGCPYKCVFCAPTNFWRKVRFHSPERVVEEIKLLKEKYKVDGILIWDDLFIANKKRLEEIVKILRSEKIADSMEFSIFGRANLINEDICKFLKDMNVTSIDFGLESGSNKILTYLKKETVTVENNRNALNLCKKYGMRTLGTFIIGSPDETEADMKQTLELFKDNNLDEGFIFQLTPLPGTELWEYAKKEGIVTDDPSFDFSRITPNIALFKPEILMTKNMDRNTFEKWFSVFQAAMNEKNRRIRISSIKHGNIKYMFSYRFLSKVIKNRKEILMYLRNSLLKGW